MMIEKLNKYFQSGATKETLFRLAQLATLKQAIKEHEDEILEALRKDLNKPYFEAYATEISMVYEELKYLMNNLSRWAKPKKVKTPITQFPASSYIHPEPYGVVLIMSPWNYPFQLSMIPLIGAIAAGNCAIVKPSGYSRNTSEVIAKIIEKCFEKNYVAVVLGGREANKNILGEKFDYIFFTGSVSVGKIVMESASKYLTPVTLELGGKSPCIVDKQVNIDLAARRIVWGKFLNAGQTCVAPDYILVDESIKNELIKRMSDYITKFYGEHPEESAQFTRIINEKHFKRLNLLMQSGRIIVGGAANEAELQIAPTIIDEVIWKDPIMQEEIFGPLLPILTYEKIDEVIPIVNAHPKPLALYLFSSNKENQKKILSSISFGGGCINDVVVHLATSFMPFGGVGESGMGRYHGKDSFDTFSHMKSVMNRSTLTDIELRYPPYKDKIKILKKILR